MNKFYFLFITALVMFLGCSKVEDPIINTFVDDSIDDQIEWVDVSFNALNYEIEPLSKATGTTDIVLVSVNRITYSATGLLESDGWQSVGIFDNLNFPSIRLAKDCIHRINIAIYKNVQLDGLSNAPGFPSEISISNRSTWNKFIETQDPIMYHLTFYRNGTRFDEPMWDLYVGASEFTAVSNLKVDVDMVRSVYGVTLNVTGDIKGTFEVSSPFNNLTSEWNWYEISNGETKIIPIYPENMGDIESEYYSSNNTYERKVFFRYTENGQTYQLGSKTATISKLDNIIFNLDIDDFLGVSTDIDVNINENSSLKDKIYN